MPQASYQHNPYAPVVMRQSYEDLSASRTPSPGPEIIDIQSSLHCHALGQNVHFIHYPTTVRDVNPYHRPQKEYLVRLFIGQLPYNVSADQAEFIILAATNCMTFHTELIHRWTRGQEPKGCVHTYCFPEDVEVILSLNKRILVDDTGFWLAEDDEQQFAVHTYCGAMKADKRLRFQNRPYQPVVIEVAKSSFRPREEQQVPAAMPPPYAFEALPELPSYEEAIGVE